LVIKLGMLDINVFLTKLAVENVDNEINATKVTMDIPKGKLVISLE